MRKIKNSVLLLFALLPFLVYLFYLIRTGEAPSVHTFLVSVLGDYSMFFFPKIVFFRDSISLVDTAGAKIFSWFMGYYIFLIVMYVVFSMFTFLITMFLDKIDRIKGGR